MQHEAVEQRLCPGGAAAHESGPGRHCGAIGAPALHQAQRRPRQAPAAGPAAPGPGRRQPADTRARPCNCCQRERPASNKVGSSAGETSAALHTLLHSLSAKSWVLALLLRHLRLVVHRRNWSLIRALSQTNGIRSEQHRVSGRQIPNGNASLMNGVVVNSHQITDVPEEEDLVGEDIQTDEASPR